MNQQTADKRPLVLVTLCGGGWHREAARILAHFPPDAFRFAYVYGHCRGVHGAKDLPMPYEGPRYPMHYLGPTRKHPARVITNPCRLILSLFEALRLVRKLRPVGVLAVGTSMAAPLFLAGRLFGCRCVFVESLTRVRRPSMTGRLLQSLRLADRFYVQWPHLIDRSPNAVFAGAVL